MGIVMAVARRMAVIVMAMVMMVRANPGTIRAQAYTPT